MINLNAVAMCELRPTRGMRPPRPASKRLKPTSPVPGALIANTTAAMRLWRPGHLNLEAHRARAGAHLSQNAVASYFLKPTEDMRPPRPGQRSVEAHQCYAGAHPSVRRQTDE